MLSVEYGPFHPALERAFLARLGELSRLPGRGPIAVVAPSRRLADRLERLAAVEGGLTLLDVHFHTFYSLALSIVDEDGWPDAELIGDPVFHDKVVDSLLDAHPALSSRFGAGRRPKALAAALRASVRDLIDAGVEPAAVGEHFGAELLKDDSERLRLSALLALQRAYEERLSELKVLSPSGLTSLAAARAGGSRLLGRLEAALYYGFYDLTGLQLAFFQAVAARCDTTLYFPHRKGHPAFAFSGAFFEQNLGGARARELPADVSGLAAGAALDRLFSPGPALKAEATPARLTLLSASGARDEAWACAKEILRLIEEEGAAFEDIGVVARTLEPYRGAIEEVFAENGIPASIGAGRPLLRHPLAKLSFNFLSLRRRDFPAADVLALLASPYFQAPGLTPRRAKRWKRLIARLGIKAGWLQWRKLEGCLADAQDGEEARALWATLCGWREELGAAPGSWTRACEAAGALLARHFALPRDASAEEESAQDELRRALESLAALDRLGRPAGAGDFLDALEEKWRRAQLEPPGGGRGVRVLGVMDARGERFAHLFMVGLKEKSFPRQVQEDPLLRDEARAALRHPAGYWIAPKAAGYDEERLLFYLMAASATQRLFCVYPRSDEAGKAEVPSLYLRELCRAAGLDLDAAAERVWRQPAEKLARCDWRRLSPKEASLRLALEGGSPAPYLRAAGRPDGPLSSALERLPRLCAFGAAGPHDGLVGPQPGWLREAREKGLSPSALDELAQCPFEFFADRLLGLGREEAPAEKGELAAWARGRLYHEALERFYRDLSPASFAGEEPFEPALERALEGCFQKAGWKELGVYPVLWQAEREAMAEALRAFAAWDLARQRADGLRPRFFELEVEGPAPAGGLRLRGRIDRLDADEAGTRFRVVDYKTRWGLPGRLAALVGKGALHQLPVYSELAQQKLGAAARCEGADILVLNDGGPRGLRYEPEEWTAQRGPFFDGVAAMVESAGRGVFPIRPDDGDFGYCRRCDFKTLCRKSHGPSRQRAATAVSDVDLLTSRPEVNKSTSDTGRGLP